MQTVAGTGLMHEYSELGMCRWLLNEKVAAAWRIQLHPVLLGARGAIDILTIFLPMAVGLACGMGDGGQPGGGRPGGAQQESGLLWQDLAKTLENGRFWAGFADVYEPNNATFVFCRKTLDKAAPGLYSYNYLR